MKKKTLILILLILIIAFIIFISKNMFKKSKNGNNMDSQEIVDKILNSNSYISEIEVQVKSNKNQNKYRIKQEYNTENGCVQEVLEPSNIAGVKITKFENKLIIENTDLNLKQVFENYEELENNNLDLYVFLEECKNDGNARIEEQDGKIVLFCNEKKLYINKETLKPEYLIIEDNNKNTNMVIKYNKIELN